MFLVSSALFDRSFEFSFWFVLVHIGNELPEFVVYGFIGVNILFSHYRECDGFYPYYYYCLWCYFVWE